MNKQLKADDQAFASVHRQEEDAPHSPCTINQFRAIDVPNEARNHKSTLALFLPRTIGTVYKVTAVEGA
jgi:hypothetical protein